MRNTLIVEDGPMFSSAAAISTPGTLIIVEDEEAADKMRRLVVLFGRKCYRAEVEADPEISARHARMTCVEVRTLAEMEQRGINEKQAMEVW